MLKCFVPLLTFDPPRTSPSFAVWVLDSTFQSEPSDFLSAWRCYSEGCMAPVFLCLFDEFDGFVGSDSFP